MQYWVLPLPWEPVAIFLASNLLRYAHVMYAIAKMGGSDLSFYNSVIYCSHLTKFKTNPAHLKHISDCEILDGMFIGHD